MRKFIALALALVATIAAPVAADSLIVVKDADSIAAFSGDVDGGSTCILTKYVGSTVGKPTVEVAAGGDVTFKIAGSADTTTGSPSLDGIFDLSTPAAAVDTMGEFVNLVNTTGSNWRAVLVSCLAADLTDGTLFTLAATDAGTPAGVAVFRDSTVASATSVFSAQVALVPADAAVNMAFWLTGSKPNTNPFGGYQAFVQHIREKITSAGVIALFEVIAVKRTYDSLGKVAETTRTLYAETGAATTVEKVLNFHNGPVQGAPGELIVVRQRTATGLTVESINGNGYQVKQ